MLSSIKEKYINRNAKIGVIGLGYVGLPLVMEFSKAGFQVTGIDVNETRVNELNKGNNYIQDVDDDALRTAVSSGTFSATTDFSVIKDLDAVSICVPTPLNKLKDPDVSYIISVMDEIVKVKHHELLIVLESTTYPGTTRDLILPRLEENGYIVGETVFLCFSPERIDPGNPVYGTHNTPKVLGGVTENCVALGKLLYEQIIESIVPVSSPEAAEMVKLLENTFRSINIGLANEVAIMCEKLGIDVWEVIDAAATKPFGYMKFTPGPGLGGHCIPIDPHYLAWKMKTLDYKARFIELAGEINTNMPNHVIELISQGLNREKKSLNGSNVLIIGVAYKPDIDDVRESPALDVIRLLESSGSKVAFYDPYVPSIQWNGTVVKSLVSLKNIAEYDAVAILTNHGSIDFAYIKENAKLIIDTRNVYTAHKDKKIIRLGVG
ncbi:MAG: nucleotide sugar dehydrogenase [Candidatus Marinimicrobia bacterium]|nr:nucleotide sugar dehydrogenase [Candidatus Neomarinimicrobiota bacterium]